MPLGNPGGKAEDKDRAVGTLTFKHWMVYKADRRSTVREISFQIKKVRKMKTSERRGLGSGGHGQQMGILLRSPGS